MKLLALALLALVALTACDDPPCPTDEGAAKAAEAYRSCISMEQHGHGGIGCGRRAYATFCAKP